MDIYLRQLERIWQENPTRENWSKLLRISRSVGSPRFTQKGLLIALGGGNITNWDYLPTGFSASIREAPYPVRKGSFLMDVDIDGIETYEHIIDASRWDGFVSVEWAESLFVEKTPLLYIEVTQSETLQPKFIQDSYVFDLFRYIRNAVTEDEGLISAMQDTDGWVYGGVSY